MDGEVDCGGPLDLPASGDHRPVRKADRPVFKAEGQSRACPHPAVPRRCDASPDDVPAQRGAAMESLAKAPLAVIMVNWRSAEETIECLESPMHSQQPTQIGRRTGRERECQYGYISVGSGSLKKKNTLKKSV